MTSSLPRRFEISSGCHLSDELEGLQDTLSLRRRQHRVFEATDPAQKFPGPHPSDALPEKSPKGTLENGIHEANRKIVRLDANATVGIAEADPAAQNDVRQDPSSDVAEAGSLIPDPDGVV